MQSHCKAHRQDAKDRHTMILKTVSECPHLITTYHLAKAKVALHRADIQVLNKEEAPAMAIHLTKEEEDTMIVMKTGMKTDMTIDTAIASHEGTEEMEEVGQTTEIQITDKREGVKNTIEVHIIEDIMTNL